VADLNETYVGTHGSARAAPLRRRRARGVHAGARRRVQGPLAVEQFKGGQSNPTYRLTAGGSPLRAAPQAPGKLLPSAHAVDREYKVMTALGAAGFPVPKTYALCTDESVIGTAFFVMDCVEGRIFWEQSLPEFANAERAAIYDEMNRVIALLHSTDYAAIGLADYGRPVTTSSARSSAGPTSTARRRPRRSRRWTT
jgi:aminoglycoside phosphotransferase (APT) family kinase protein